MKQKLVMIRSMTNKNWTKTTDNLPSEGVLVDTMKSDGSVSRLKRHGRLWFYPDGKMYVYYIPSFWKSIDWKAI